MQQELQVTPGPICVRCTGTEEAWNGNSFPDIHFTQALATAHDNLPVTDIRFESVYADDYSKPICIQKSPGVLVPSLYIVAGRSVLVSTS
jgi:hypothetical protein